MNEQGARIRIANIRGFYSTTHTFNVQGALQLSEAILLEQ